MSRKSIEPKRLGETVNKELQLYTADVQYGVCLLVDEKANKLFKLIKENAPTDIRTKGRKKGRTKNKYKRSWRIKVTTDDFSYYEKTVYASGEEYRLTHLLEKGHAKRNGGRVEPKVHIAPARDQIEREYIKGVESLLKQSQKNGGGYKSAISYYKK